MKSAAVRLLECPLANKIRLNENFKSILFIDRNKILQIDIPDSDRLQLMHFILQIIYVHILSRI